MTRPFTVAAAAFLAVSGLTVWTHEASAFTTAVRLCVQKQRKTLRNTILTSRATAQQAYSDGFKACFDNTQQACVSACQATLTTCQVGPNKIKDDCTNSSVANDGITSCLETFDAAIDTCAALPTTNNPVQDAQAQIKCAQDARLARQSCQGVCAVRPDVAPVLDSCNITFGDCTERCG